MNIKKLTTPCIKHYIMLCISKYFDIMIEDLPEVPSMYNLTKWTTKVHDDLIIEIEKK